MSLKIHDQIRKIPGCRRGEADDRKLRKSERAILRTLALRAHDDGTSIYCSVPFIMADTGLARWSVQRSTRELERKGYLISISSRSGGRGHPIGYRIPLNEYGFIIPQAAQAREEEEQEEQPAAAGAPPPAAVAVVTRRRPAPAPEPAPADEPFLDAEYVEQRIETKIDEIEKYQRQTKVWTSRLNIRRRLYEQKLASNASLDEIEEAEDLIQDAEAILAELARAAPGALQGKESG